MSAFTEQEIQAALNAWFPELTPKKHETKAKKLLRMCGIRMASLYLKNRGYSAEQAVIILLR